MITYRVYHYLGLFVLIFHQIQAHNNHANCWSCSYTFAGHDGSAGYECVDNPANFTNARSIECHEGMKCVIDATYEKTVPLKLLSMDRGCRAPQSENGCVEDSSRPSCSYSCDENLCNGIHGDLRNNIYKDTNAHDNHINCWSCTYTFAGHDGSAGYECVDNPANFTNARSIECHEGMKCVIDATYEKTVPLKLLSMDRGCRAPQSENGCVEDSSRPSCSYSCDENLCNGIHGDLRNNIYKDTNGIDSIRFSVYPYLLLIVGFLCL